MKNLFGEKTIKKDIIEIVYKGPSFDNKMEIKDLYHQLEALENIIKNTVNTLKECKKIDFNSRDIKISIKLKRGSFAEIVEVVFNNQILQAVISGCFIATYTYFLTNRNNKSKRFVNEIEMLEKNREFKSSMKKVVAPMNVGGDQLNIIGNNNNIIITQEQKENFYRSLEDIEENELLKNGEFEEDIEGEIRKLDLDANQGNFFGFKIKDREGVSKIKSSIRGEINLNDIKEILGEPLKVKANVKYKDSEIVHIEILDYEIVNKQEGFNF